MGGERAVTFSFLAFDSVRFACQNPEYQSEKTYQIKGTATSGVQPTRHQKLSPRPTKAVTLARMAVCAAKKALPIKAAPPVSHTPQVRYSALSSIVNPSQSSRMVLTMETASASQSKSR